jgi:hypothetical protein
MIFVKKEDINDQIRTLLNVNVVKLIIYFGTDEVYELC